MAEIISRDANNRTVGAGVTNDADMEVTTLRVDPITHYLLVNINATPGPAFGAGSQIARRDQNNRTVCMGWDDTNGVLQEILTDEDGNLLCDLTFI